KGTSAVTVQDRVYLTFALQIGSSIFDGPGHREGRKRLIKIRLGDKLVYDVSPTSEILAESAEFAKCFTYYPGDYTQLPDPHIEAIEGVGNVSAYRGTAYVVFHNFDTTDYGGVPPQFFFETATEATVVQDVRLVTDVKSYGGSPANLEVADVAIGWPAGFDIVAVTPNGRYAAGARYNSTTGIELRKYDAATGLWSVLAVPSSAENQFVSDLAWSGDGTTLAVSRFTNGPGRLSVYRLVGDDLVALVPPTFPDNVQVSKVTWFGLRLYGTYGNTAAGGQFFYADLIGEAFDELVRFGGPAGGAGTFISLNA